MTTQTTTQTQPLEFIVAPAIIAPEPPSTLSARCLAGWRLFWKIGEWRGKDGLKWERAVEANTDHQYTCRECRTRRRTFDMHMREYAAWVFALDPQEFDPHTPAAGLPAGEGGVPGAPAGV